MPIPDTPVEQWRVGVRNAWAAVELADSEAKLERWESAAAQARNATAWAAVAAVAANAP
jgi:hypothetical protein